ncbi:MAG: FG-GAP-like repeat-containing protein [Pirellulaceae bacterium]
MARGETLASVAASGVAPPVADALIASLIPPEGDFLVILIDALDGNDIINVGPTVQKTVWVDGGAGDDVITIQGGNAILVDRAESSRSAVNSNIAGRNDIPLLAFDLVSPTGPVGAQVDRVFNGSTFETPAVNFNDLSLDSPDDVDWFAFTFQADFDPAAKIELASGSAIDALDLEIFRVDATADNSFDEDALISEIAVTGTGDRSEISLAGLSGGQRYLLKVSGNKIPTLYDLRINLIGEAVTAGDGTPAIAMSLRSDTVRRDVILGGAGNDILQGGAGEDFIFGGLGNDVLTGGRDRGASDLLFGGPGDDTFQIIPDALPLLGNQADTNFDPATNTFIPTYSDQFIGGDGEDRVLFLGGDLDRRGLPVPDYASIRYNTGLHRYEFTSLVWDIGQQAFVTTTDFADRTVYEQEFLFYQTRDIETTEFSTRAGDDVVHADPEFKFLPIDVSGVTPVIDATADPDLFEEWGIDRGDFEQGASEAALTIDLGSGNDFAFGTVLDDTIIGGPGDDTIVGQLGNDDIQGGGGNDTIFGHSPASVQTAYPHLPTQPNGFVHGQFVSELYAYDLATPALPFDVTRSGIDLNDPIQIVDEINSESFGFQADSTRFVSALSNIGDFNNDGADDFIVSNAEESFLIFGPVVLDDLEIASELANIVIKHESAGRPSATRGDVNADGIADLVLSRRDEFESIVTVIFGGEDAGLASGSVLQWEREWNAEFLANLRESSPQTVVQVQLPARVLSASGTLSTSLLNIDGDEFADLLISTDIGIGANATASGNLPLGYVFSGASINNVVGNESLSTKDSVLTVMTTDATKQQTIVTAGDVNGDGRDDLFFGGIDLPLTLAHFTGPATIDAPIHQTFTSGQYELTLTLNNDVVATLPGPTSGSAAERSSQINDAIGQTELVGRVFYDSQVGFQTVEQGEAVSLDVACFSLDASDACFDLGNSPYSTNLLIRPSLNQVPISASGPGTYTSTINVNASEAAGLISDVKIFLMIEHTFTEDLDVTLIHPDGTRVKLFDDVGKNGVNFGVPPGFGAVRSMEITEDAGAIPVESGTAPFTSNPGGYRPEESFSILDGKSIEGQWTLEIHDDGDGDGGLLHQWELRIDTIESLQQNGSSPLNTSTETFLAGLEPTTAVVELDPTAPTFQARELTRLGDLNSDGFDDFALTSEDRSEVYLGQADTVAMLSSPLVTVTGDQLHLTAGDFNGDGEVDLAFTSIGLDNSNSIHIFDAIGRKSGNLELDDADRTVSFTGQASSSIDHIDLSSVFNADVIRNRSNGTDDDDNDPVDDSQGLLVTDAWAISQNANGNGLPNDGFFPATAFHPDVQLAYRNDNDGDNAVLLNDLGESVTFNVSASEIESLTLFGFAAQGQSDVELTLNYADGSVSLETRFTDWFDNPVDGTASGDAVRYQLIDGMDRSSSGNFQNSNDPAVFGHRFHIDPLRKLNSVTLTKTDTSISNFVLLGAMTQSTVVSPSAVDLNSDGLYDLSIPTGSETYVIYGSRARLELPGIFDVLENFSVAGSGSFVVDRGTGRVEIFDDGGDPFIVEQGNERWFQFTTLGDGKGGNSIRIDEGVQADLIDAVGGVISVGQRVFDLRTLEAGTYYLRVTRDAAASNGSETPFRIEFAAPVRGQTHESPTHPDRDRIDGGDGDDILFGNNDLDAIFGGSGVDTISAEAIEFRDRDTSDVLSGMLVTETTFENPGPVLNPTVDIPNASLKVAIAERLGLGVKQLPGTPDDFALAFDGINDSVSTGALIDHSTGATFEFWAKPSNQNATPEEIPVVYTEAGSSASLAGWRVSIRNNPVLGPKWLISDGTFGLSGAVDIDVDQWQHIAGTFDPEFGLRLYKNGELVFTDSTRKNTPAITTGVKIGTGTGSPTTQGFYTGEIDEVRIWDEILQPEQIRELFETDTLPDTISTTSLVGYWQFDDVVGTSVPDQSGSGNAGTIVGGASIQLENAATPTTQVIDTTFLASELFSIFNLKANTDDLQGLQHLSNLERLDLSTASVAGLANEDLDVLIPRRLTDPLFAEESVGLSRIESLDLTGQANITDISALANLKSLRELRLVGTGIDPVAASTLDTLAALPLLSVLQISEEEENFGEQQIISTASDGPTSVATADLDGDGHIDVLSASSNDGTIAWYKNQGNGTFGSRQVLSAAETGAREVQAVDLDGDGDIDVLSASSNRITWFEKNGLGGFDVHVISSSVIGAFSISSADVDGDGDMDILSASTSGDRIVWFENNGSQTFSERTVATDADFPNRVVAGDLDGDGDIDVASSSQNDNRIAWYENDGNENFTTHTISASANLASSVAIADVNGDGKLDVLSSSIGDSKIAWYRNNGDQTFTEQVITTSATMLSVSRRLILTTMVIRMFLVFR